MWHQGEYAEGRWSQIADRVRAFGASLSPLARFDRDWVFALAAPSAGVVPAAPRLVLPDAPLPDEIALIFCLATRGRPNARVGGMSYASSVSSKT